MLAVDISGIIAWCAIPKQVLLHVQTALKTAQTQIHVVALLNKNEVTQYKELQEEGVTGRYLEK